MGVNTVVVVGIDGGGFAGVGDVLVFVCSSVAVFGLRMMGRWFWYLCWC